MNYRDLLVAMHAKLGHIVTVVFPELRETEPFLVCILGR
jgi:hypothetical protein